MGAHITGQASASGQGLVFRLVSLVSRAWRGEPRLVDFIGAEVHWGEDAASAGRAIRSRRERVAQRT